MITAQHNQELIDIALWAQGDADRLFELAVLNSRSITGDLTAGEQLAAADPETATAARVVKLLSGNPPASIGKASTSVAGRLARLLQPTNTNNSVQAIQGQMLVDMAMQLTGDASKLFALAVLNNRPITHNLVPGELPEANTGDLSAANLRLAQLLTQSDKRPASGDGLRPASIVSQSFVLRKLADAPTGKQVQRGQALVDLAMQYQGDASLLYSLAASLGMNITEQLTDGNYLAVVQQAADARKAKLVDMLNRPKDWPASDFDKDGPPISVKLDGIDYWYVWEYVVQ